MAVLIGACLVTASCSKDWLDAKPDMKLTVPNKLVDYQYLLNNRSVFGTAMPALGELANDDYYLTYENWQALSSVIDRNTYIWADDIYEENRNSDWISAYSQILQANVVLDGIDKIDVSESEVNLYNNVKGQALFFRANCFYALTQLFCEPYVKEEATGKLGLPLKMSSEITAVTTRSDLETTYSRLINDLVLAAELLPDRQDYLTQPSRTAAMALLARIFLSMEDYPKALEYANKVLAVKDDLMDFNALDVSLPYPIPLFNEEVIWHAEMRGSFNNTNLSGLVDTILYQSYNELDIRRNAFYFFRNGGFQFKGNYRGTRLELFCGLATDEVYLIAAECMARSGQTSEALALLQQLLVKRYKDGYVPTMNWLTGDDILRLILNERRKELVFRGLRWSDLRRLRHDSRFSVTLTRQLNGTYYKLESENKKYTFLIPPDEIRLSGIQQNPR